jgi:hypothetical protein
MPAIETMRVPTLVLLGGADRMGSTAVSNDRWTAGLARAGNAHAKVVVIDGMGHAATIGSEHKMGSATMPAYLTEVASFLQALPGRSDFLLGASEPRDLGTIESQLTTRIATIRVSDFPPAPALTSMT